MKVYIASPFFNPEERNRIKRLVAYLYRNGLDTAKYFIPMEHFIKDADKLSNYEWSKKVFEMDVNALKSSDLIIAVYDGHYSDSGTAWEIGLGYALQIPIILLVTDLKLDLSIMPLCSCKEVYDFEGFLHGDHKLSKETLTTLK